MAPYDQAQYGYSYARPSDSQYGSYNSSYQSTRIPSTTQYQAPASQTQTSGSYTRTHSYEGGESSGWASLNNQSGSSYDTSRTPANGFQSTQGGGLSQYAYTTNNNTNQSSSYQATTSQHGQYSGTYPQNSQASSANITYPSHGRPQSVTSVNSARSDGGQPTVTNPRQAPAQSHKPNAASYSQPRGNAGSGWTSQQSTAQNYSVPQSNQRQYQRQDQVPANTAAPRASTSEQYQSQSYAPTAPVTVDPSQVYDNSHEIQRANQKRAEAEAVKKAEAERKAAEERRAEEARLQAEKAEAEAAARAQGAMAAKELAQQARSGDCAKSRGRKGKAKGNDNSTDESAADTAAAMALMASANAGVTGKSGQTALEKEMMKMFAKMREFNKKDPAMLSRLWQEERDRHLAEGSPDSEDAVEPAEKATPRKRAASAKSSSRPKGSKGKKKGASQQNAEQQPESSTAAASEPVVPVAAAGEAVKPPAQVPAKAAQTIWPADKKATIAAAAALYVSQLPENSGKRLTSLEVSAILDSNPSYVELCRSIVDKGFKLDFSRFAKHLISAVPEVNKPSAPKGIPRGVPGLESAAPRKDVNASLRDAEARLHNGESLLPKPKANSASRNKAQSTSHAHPNSHSKRSPKAATTNAAAETPTRVSIDPSLEGLDAVKDFVDIGDPLPLGGNDGDATFVPPTATKSRPRKPKPSVTPGPPTKEDMARKRTFADLIDLTAAKSDSDEEVFFPPLKRHEQNSATILPSPPRTDQETTVQAADASSRSMPADAPSQKDGMSTFRLDVGARPTVSAQEILGDYMNRPRQSIQQPAQGNANVNQPALPQSGPTSAPPPSWSRRFDPSAPIDIPATHPAKHMIVAQPLDSKRALRRAKYDSRTIARDVLLACGRHPDMRSLNAHLETLKQPFPYLSNNNVDLATFRWDVVDPGGPAPGSGSVKPPEPTIISVDLGAEADDESDGTGKRHKPAPGSSWNASNRPATNAMSSFPAIPSSDVQPHRRVGRPPGSSKKPKTPSTQNPPGQSTPGTGGDSSGYKALWALQPRFDANGNPIKRVGRPPGWRKHMQSTPSGTPAPSTKRKSEPEPVYQVYKCEWRECAAELHNVATLRKHVYKKHAQRDDAGKLPCHWNACGKVRTVTDTETGQTRSEPNIVSFQAEDRWKAHIEAEHIRPIAWRLGDGPTGGVSDHTETESEAYLSDRLGRQVTPKIAMPDEVEPSSARRGKRSAEESARQQQADLERKRRTIGPGVDKGGARLANEKRRQGFVDHDDGIELVDDSD